MQIIIQITNQRRVKKVGPDTLVIGMTVKLKFVIEVKMRMCRPVA